MAWICSRRALTLPFLKIHRDGSYILALTQAPFHIDFLASTYHNSAFCIINISLLKRKRYYMFVNCTFSLVAIHVFGFINANSLENHEDPALLISGVLKPVFTVSDWNQKFMLLKLNLVSILFTHWLRFSHERLNRSKEYKQRRVRIWSRPAVSCDGLFRCEDPPFFGVLWEERFSLAWEKGRIIHEVISPRGR